MTSQTAMHNEHPRPSHPRRWRRRRARAAVLSLAVVLTSAAGGLAATPAWAGGGCQITATIPVGGEPAGIALSPCGGRAYVADTAGDVSVINTATNQVIATVPGLSSPFGVAVSPNGSHIYVTNQTGQGTVSVIAHT